MHSARAVIAGILAFCVLLLATASALADGKFFPLLKVVDEPGIQAQRALISYRDSIETLIVQSDIDHAGKSLGWVLPLPAEPTSIEACEPYTLTLLSSAVGPHVADYPGKLIAVSVLFLLIALVYCKPILAPSRKLILSSALRAIFLVFVILFVAFLLMPTLGLSSGPIGDIDILQTARAGVYDVTVIRGENGEAVRGWLNSNGFGCSEAAVQILDDYASSGWCFLSATVAADATGPITHHPLKVAFPTEEAIYPLRLTGEGADTVQLDLLVIAEKRAKAHHMATWLCDSFAKVPLRDSFEGFPASRPQTYRPDNIRLWAQIGGPDITDLLWPGCVVTRLRGRLSVADMQSDLRLEWSAPRTYWKVVYSRAAGLGHAEATALFMAALGVAWCTRTAKKRGWSLSVALRKRTLPVMVTALAAGAIHYAVLDIVPTKHYGNDRTFRRVAAGNHLRAIDLLCKKTPHRAFSRSVCPGTERHVRIRTLQPLEGNAANAGRLLHPPHGDRVEPDHR